ncbi:hypothetical protein ACHAXT_008308 [Thalassiosira profunda]
MSTASFGRNSPPADVNSSNKRQRLDDAFDGEEESAEKVTDEVLRFADFLLQDAKQAEEAGECFGAKQYDRRPAQEVKVQKYFQDAKSIVKYLEEQGEVFRPISNGMMCFNLAQRSINDGNAYVYCYIYELGLHIFIKIGHTGSGKTRVIFYTKSHPKTIAGEVVSAYPYEDKECVENDIEAVDALDVDDESKPAASRGIITLDDIAECKEPIVISSINLTNMANRVQEEVTRRMIACIKSIVVYDPLKHTRMIDAVWVEMNGPPFFCQHLLVGFLHELSDEIPLSGCIDVKGFLYRLAPHFGETGLQLLMEELYPDPIQLESGKTVEFKTEAHAHEMVNSRHLGMALQADARANAKLRILLRKLLKPHEQKGILKYGKRPPLCDNWKPGDPEGMDKPLTNMSQVLNNISHHEGNWEDMNLESPPPEDRYNDELLSIPSRDNAFQRRLDGRLQQIVKIGIIQVEDDGGILVLTIDESSMQGTLGKGQDFVQNIKDREPNRPVGATVDRAQWTDIEDGEEERLYPGLLFVLRLDWGDDTMRILFLRRPSCWPFDSRPSTNHYQRNVMLSKRIHAEMLQFVNVFCDFAETPNPEFEPDTSLDRPLYRNIVIQYYSSEFDLDNYHLAAVSAVLHQKSFMHQSMKLTQTQASEKAVDVFHTPDATGSAAPTKMAAVVPKNLYSQGCNSREVKGKVIGGMLLKPDRNKYHFGANSKRRLTDPKRETDHHILVKFANALSCSLVGSDSEHQHCLSTAVELLMTKLSGGKVTSSTKNKRFSSVLLSNHFNGTLLAQVEALFDERTANRGNTTALRQASTAEVKTNDELLSEFASSFTKFFVQIQGTAGDNASFNGKPFFLPDEGTVINGVVFSRDIFVPITYLTLTTTRLRDNREHNTKAHKSVKFTEYGVEYNENMMTHLKTKPRGRAMGVTTKSQELEVNRYNVVEVRFYRRAGNASPKPQISPGHGSPVQTPHSHDVISVRGSTSHPGNARFAKKVAANKNEFSDPRIKKVVISARIVAQIRALDPPGRFLKKDPKTGLWVEIGDKQAWKKAEQAMRALVGKESAK